MEAEALVAAGEGIGGVDGGVAGLAEESVVRAAVPTRSPAEAAVAGARGAAAHGVRGRAVRSLAVVHGKVARGELGGSVVKWGLFRVVLWGWDWMTWQEYRFCCVLIG